VFLSLSRRRRAKKARQEIADTLAIKIPDRRMAHHALGQAEAAGYAKIICGLAPKVPARALIMD